MVNLVSEHFAAISVSTALALLRPSDLLSAYVFPLSKARAMYGNV